MRARSRSYGPWWCLVTAAAVTLCNPVSATSPHSHNIQNHDPNTSPDSRSPPIRARIQASWEAAPLLVQILETLSIESPRSFFPFIDTIIHAPPSISPIQPKAAGLSDQQTYSRTLDLLHYSADTLHIHNGSIDALKLALALREASPRIQTHYQLYRRHFEDLPDTDDSDHSGESYVIHQGIRYESAQSLLLAVERPLSDTPASKIYDFDNVFPHYVAAAPVAILYGDLSTANFANLHGILSKSAHEGKVRYILRWKPSQYMRRQKLALSGFGAALDLKRVDYLTIDDRDTAASDGVETDAESSSERLVRDSPRQDGEYASIFDVSVQEMVQLKESQLADIGLRATHLVMHSANPLQTLRRLTGDFPKYAHSLATSWVTAVSPGIISELKETQSTIIDGGRNLFIMNGQQLQEADLKPFTFLRLMRKERQLVESIISAGRSSDKSEKDVDITPKMAIDILTHPAVGNADAATDPRTARPGQSATTEMFDASDRIEVAAIASLSEGAEEIDGKTVVGPILYWNDLARDSRYRHWPSSLSALLQPMYPGQTPQVKRNLINVNLVLRLDKRDTHSLLAGEIGQFISRGLPIRFGMIPALPEPTGTSEDTVGTTVAKLIWYIVDHAGRTTALAFSRELGSNEKEELTIPLVTTAYSKIAREWNKKLRVKIDDGIEPSHTPSLLLSVSDILGTSSSSGHANIAVQLSRRLESAYAYSKRLGLLYKPDSDTLGHFFVNGKLFILDEEYRQNLQNAMSAQMQHLQQQIHSGGLFDDDDVDHYFYNLPTTYSRRSAWVFPGVDANPLRFVNIAEVDKIVKCESVGNAVDDAKVSIWILADLKSPALVQLPTAARKVVYQSHGVSVRICLIHNPSDVFAEDTPFKRPPPLQWATSWDSLDAEYDGSALSAGEWYKFGRQGNALANFIKLKAGDNGIVINGRVLGPLPDNAFNTDELESLIAYESAQRLSAAQEAISAVLSQADVQSDLFAKLTSVISLAYSPGPARSLLARPNMRRSMDYNLVPGNYTSIVIGDESTAILQFGVILDPLSEAAQTWSAVLETVSLMSSVSIRLWFNPLTKRKELPLKRFYRYNMPHEMSFDASGSEITPTVEFMGVPQSTLLTLALDTQSAWQTFPKESIHDLDNIRLSDLKSSARERGIDALFEVSNIIVEGHGKESKTGGPPRGLQLLLSDGKDTTDTLVMANLGYHQFKANPGLWNMTIREGRSSEVFEVESVGHHGSDEIALTTLEGATIFPVFKRKPGMDGIDLLDEDTDEGSTSQARGPKVAEILKQKFQSFFGKSTDIPAQSIVPSKKGADINIFTVASGLLYERMAMIMILSVLRHTNSTVKFWFINNFLSPSFKAFIPQLAREYNFEYELITYTWPHWLRSQKEKQRTIWGYKILFLDVLFPLELNRVIFVDSDQIVRTDLQELVNMDLKGAPYAYTPMGDDREEMEGFRFWKQGYWRDHLRGRPYHISALYVIDLDRFRQMAAGDRLRGQYQALSADPHSLSNLDQDLPNNMQHQIPIHTLDRSWLWCETWCSDESLATAKTIDLCNNPKTHEPKLARAKRLIPEWSVYDKEIADLAARISAQARESNSERDASTMNGSDVAADAFADEASQLEQARMQQKEFVEEGDGGHKVETTAQQSVTSEEHRKDEL